MGDGRFWNIWPVGNWENDLTGVLYVELEGVKTDHTFVDQMICELDLKVKPHGIIDLVLAHISPAYATPRRCLGQF